jgi:tagatose 1,6-diphosphate aldolase GatY/KbaY
MLQNTAAVLPKMRQDKKCVVAFNVYNLETIQAAFTAAQQKCVPVIIAFGEGYLNHASLDTIAAMVMSLDKAHDLPVVLHLDHAKSFSTIKAAIEAGFTSVMYDGSHLPFAENAANTAAVVEYAHQRGVTVEAELGYLNPEEGADFAAFGPESFTDPEQARRFVEETGVDSLAVAVGNAHGLYKHQPTLDIARIRHISEATGIPLVLHGSSGIPKEQLRAAAEAGIAKINVNTEVSLAAVGALRQACGEDSKIRLDAVMRQAREAMVGVMAEFLELTT